MLSVSVTGTVPLLVTHIANLLEMSLLIFVSCMRPWKGLFLRLNQVKVNTNKNIVQNETQYGVLSTYNGQRHIREGQHKGLIQALRETTGLHSPFFNNII